METGKIRHFSDLIAYQKAHAFALAVYATSTQFPAGEQFGITSQIRRAAVSITSNIAEGFARSTAKDKCQFYTIAKGSLAEVESQLLLARDLHYLSNESHSHLREMIDENSKLLSALMRHAPAK